MLDNIAWWKLCILILSLVSIGIGISQIVRSYFIDLSFLTPHTTQEPFVKVFPNRNSHLVLLEGELRSNDTNFYRNSPIQIDMRIITSNHSNVNVARAQAIPIVDSYPKFDNSFADEILLTHGDYIVRLEPKSINSSWLDGSRKDIRFSKSGEYSILVFLYDNTGRIVESTLATDQFSIRDNFEMFQEEIARQSIINGVRIEGLTWVGAGFAVMMFLVEIRIRNRKD